MLGCVVFGSTLSSASRHTPTFSPFCITVLTPLESALTQVHANKPLYLPLEATLAQKPAEGGASLPCPSGQSFSGGVRTHNRQKRRASYGSLPGERREDGKARMLWIGNLYGNSTLQERSEHQKPGILRASIQGPSLSRLTWPWCRS